MKTNTMKKIAAIALSTVMLVGCGKDNEPEDRFNGPKDEGVQPTDKVVVTFHETWGVTETFKSGTGENAQSCFINFPNFYGTYTGDGIMSEDLDGTLYFIAGQNDESPTIESLKDFFPAYFPRIEAALIEWYGDKLSDISFVPGVEAETTLNGYSMRTCSGEITFLFEGNPAAFGFMAYATQLQSNGAYAYWIAFDTSGNLSRTERVQETAMKMALTFREI